MGLVDYGSDSDDSDSEQPTTIPTPVATTSKPTTAKPLPSKPSTSTPVPVPAKKKIALIPTLLKPSRGSDDDEEDSGPARKKPKLLSETKKEGKGKSALLDMLPPPKRVVAVPPPSTSSTKVLGGGPSGSISGNDAGSGIGGDVDFNSSGLGFVRGSSSRNGPTPTNDALEALLPPSLRKGKGKEVKSATPAFDLFGLAEEPTPSSSSSSSKPPSTLSKPPTISSAPEITEYIPPPPTATDPYPGYYQLPSGSWAAYDPKYYMSFWEEQQNLQSGGDMPKDRSWKGVGGQDMDDVDVQKSLEMDRRLEEERGKLIAPPKVYDDADKFKPMGKTTGRAGQRHQLSALLKDAHMNREALEERIAIHKRNKRESGTKYGF